MMTSWMSAITAHIPYFQLATGFETFLKEYPIYAIIARRAIMIAKYDFCRNSWLIVGPIDSKRFSIKALLDPSFFCRVLKFSSMLLVNRWCSPSSMIPNRTRYVFWLLI